MTNLSTVKGGQTSKAYHIIARNDAAIEQLTPAFIQISDASSDALSAVHNYDTAISCIFEHLK